MSINKFEINPIKAICFFDSRINIGNIDKDIILDYIYNNNNTFVLSSKIANIFVIPHEGSKVKFIYEDVLTIYPKLNTQNYNIFHDAKFWKINQQGKSLNLKNIKSILIFEDGSMSYPYIYAYDDFDVNCKLLYANEEMYRISVNIDTILRISTFNYSIEDRYNRKIYIDTKKLNL